MPRRHISLSISRTFPPVHVAILNVHPSCGCTTAQLPPLPWTLAPGTNGQINVTVNIAGKSGTLFKTLNVSTDKGSKILMLKIVIAPLVFTNVVRNGARAIRGHCKS